MKLEIIVTEEFERLYKKLPKSIRNKTEKQEKLFRKNPFYPSLHTEKLNPKGKQLWSFRVDKKYRVAFRFIDSETTLFLAIGSHDWIYNIKF